ncbi:MAG: hypothetical protein M0R03_16170 [Novosphingobium sp.]|nr:hypothetical protein [Novosphingobium sp.]
MFNNIIKQAIIDSTPSYLNESVESSNCIIPKQIIKKLKTHKHSLGEHPCFPPDEDTTFEYKLVLNYFNENFEDLDNVDVVSLKNKLSKLLVKCNKLEKPIIEFLEKKCVENISEKFSTELLGIFETNLVDNIEYQEEDVNKKDDFEFDSVEDLNSLTKEVYKRRIINAINEGIAYDYTTDILKTNISKIYELNPELISVYYNINKINSLLTFIDDDKNSSDKTLGSVSEVEINNEIKISVKALNYLALTYESIKALMNKISLIALPEDINRIGYVTSKADVQNLVWDLRLGIPIWDTICKIQGNNNIVPYIKLIQLPTDEFFDIMREILAKTKKGKSYLEKLNNKSEKEKSFNNRIDKKRKKAILLGDNKEYFDENELLALLEKGEEYKIANNLNNNDLIDLV